MSAMGAPVDRPRRMPESGSARSDSIPTPPAAAVAALPAPQFVRDGSEVDGQTRGDPLQNRDERLAVRLAGCEKSQHGRLILSEISATPGSATHAFSR